MFQEQAEALFEGGVDLFILETFSELSVIEQAIRAVREVSRSADHRADDDSDGRQNDVRNYAGSIYGTNSMSWAWMSSASIAEWGRRTS